MARLILIAAFSLIVSVIIPSGQACGGYAELNWKMGNDPYCSNPRERTGWTWLYKVNCNCCPGFVRDGIPGKTAGICVPICYPKCAARDSNTKCTPEQIKKMENWENPGSKEMSCPADHDTA
uniref:Nfi_0 protein n=2 Tax=Fopius arisanus TaxID=64838 RepID=A0A0C9Q7M7_9HYME